MCQGLTHWLCLRFLISLEGSVCPITVHGVGSWNPMAWLFPPHMWPGQDPKVFCRFLFPS